ncbi:hypothetical protein HK101_002180 [Irineochytrium annulatum]|nr:hypothetical protein HK101_002180 [Irineochytrium annulatum]
MEVAVIGGGLGGLATAIAVAQTRRRHRVTLYESTAEIKEVGAGLQLTPNGTRLLARWGVLDRLLPLAAEPKSLMVLRYDGTKVLAYDPAFGEDCRRKYGAPFLDLHRADVQSAMVERAKELGVVVRLNCALESVGEDGGSFTLASGEVVKADAIFCADGVWSKGRKEILGGLTKPVPTGDLAYRIVLSLDQVKDEDLRTLISQPELRFWAGPNGHAVGYSLRGGNMYNVVLLAPDNLPATVSRQSGSLEEMRELFAKWDPTLQRLLSHVTSVDKWRLTIVPSLPTWVHPTGTFAILGDAAHATLPYLAQGASMALEDGGLIGALMENACTNADVRKAMREFERHRRPRCEQVIRTANKQREDFHMVDGPAQVERDAVFMRWFGRKPRERFPSHWTCPDVQPWIYSYDPYKVTEEDGMEAASFKL